VTKSADKSRCKRGRAFEECVADVVRAIDPHATVQQGTWIDGPDGRRDRDVMVQGVVDGKSYVALIECKDYDPATTGPVGIAVVDALDSKRRDLASDIAMICSNAGFTEPAVRKAQRVGIVLSGVFRQADGRLRHQLVEQVYFRRLKIEHLGVRLDQVAGGDTQQCMDVAAAFQGHPIANWVCQHFVSVIMSNPIGGGHYTGTFHLKRPTSFDLAGGATFLATEIFAECVLSGGWFEQSAVIDGTAGVYDFVRRRVHMGTGPFQFHIKDMDVTKGTPIDFPPKAEVDATGARVPGELWLQLLYLLDANCRHPVPALDDLIVEADLDPVIQGLPLQLQRSAPSDDAKPLQYFVTRNPKVGPGHSFTLTSPGDKK
jgi:hypothetical protein